MPRGLTSVRHRKGRPVCIRLDECLDDRQVKRLWGLAQKLCLVSGCEGGWALRQPGKHANTRTSMTLPKRALPIVSFEFLPVLIRLWRICYNWIDHAAIRVT